MKNILKILGIILFAIAWTFVMITEVENKYGFSAPGFVIVFAIIMFFAIVTYYSKYKR